MRLPFRRLWHCWPGSCAPAGQDRCSADDDLQLRRL